MCLQMWVDLDYTQMDMIDHFEFTEAFSNNTTGSLYNVYERFKTTSPSAFLMIVFLKVLM